MGCAGGRRAATAAWRAHARRLARTWLHHPHILWDLVSGRAVMLASGVVVPAISKPRCAGKLLKLATLFEFFAAHRKVSGPWHRQPGKYTTAAFEPGTRNRLWWTDAKQWRRMHAELHHGVPVPPGVPVPGQGSSRQHMQRRQQAGRSAACARKP